MNKDKKVTPCYIASFSLRSMDPFLKDHGVSNGIISFSIPDYGVMFRCRSEGESLQMEFSAFFSLLEFIKTKMKNEKIQTIQVFSSHPHFVFAFSSYSDKLKKGTMYRQLLDEYAKILQISVGYVKPLDNKALNSPADYPSLPKDKNVSLDFKTEELSKTEFKPFQKGIKL